MAMAVDVYADCVAGISPRISFSHDLKEAENVPIESYTCRLDSSLLDSSTFDFAFSVDSSITRNPSTADELFSDGKILPMDIKMEPRTEKPAPHQSEFSPSLAPQIENLNPSKKRLKDYLVVSVEDQKPKSFWKFRRSNSLNCDDSRSSRGLIASLKSLSRSSSTSSFIAKRIQEEKPTPRSFWKFKRSCSTVESSTEKIPASKSSKHFRRSASLNCDDRGNQGLIRSLNSLSRSNSTGSATNPKHLGAKKEQSEKKATSVHSKTSPPSSKMYCYSSQKGQFRKNCGAYGKSTTARAHPIRLGDCCGQGHATLGAYPAVLGLPGPTMSWAEEKAFKAIYYS
ncbi:hypothetical protein Nepgr_003749 [Nepenthes gracilis]|uniref:Uncharacterized protein n=1 Tax=Nepenthes gracilis TaxID=150966 RepID=A0AAD3S037_NEPGR|nr:hypothetical protein Nepgr_003749 [Nepenthes gracilis]